jgi:tripartite-type tricarboxylate transporter receptor subunit TctC
MTVNQAISRGASRCYLCRCEPIIEEETMPYSVQAIARIAGTAPKECLGSRTAWLHRQVAARVAEAPVSPIDIDFNAAIKTRTRRPLPILTTLLLALATSASGHAQDAARDWPTKPVTIVVANVAGGGTDLEARLYADKLSATFGKPFTIEYKPGAGGAIGAAQVAKAAPDGHTLLAATTSFTVTPVLSAKVPYDVTRDFAAVSLMSSGYVVLFASVEFPPNNLTEYIAYAKAYPGKILWGTSGVGAMNHLSGEYFHSELKAPATFVHYKGGSQAVNDVLGGRIHVHPGSLSGMMQWVKQGKLKAIVALSRTRVPQFPDVPTAHESGITDFEQPNYFGLVTTAGTPPGVVEKLSAELRRIAKLPEIVKAVEAEGSVMVASTPAEFNKYIATQISRWSRLVKEKNIKPE